MPTYGHPGVYVEEVPGGAKPIEGVSTSVTAFVGTVSRGSPNEAVLIHSYEEYLALYGTPMSQIDPMEIAVGAFYQNGGRDAYIMRVVHDGGSPSFLEIDASRKVLKVSATTVGQWGGKFWIRVTTPKRFAFTLEVLHQETRLDGTTYFKVDETFSNLTMNELDPNYAKTVVNRDSQLVSIDLGSGAPAPVQGTLVGSEAPPASETDKNKYFFNFIDKYTGTNLNLEVDVDGRGRKKIELTKSELRGVVAGNDFAKDASAIIGVIIPKLAGDPYKGLAMAYDGTRFTLTSPSKATYSSVTVFDGDLAKAMKVDPASTTPHPGSEPFLPNAVAETQLTNGSATDPQERDITSAFAKLKKVRDISIIVLPVAPDKYDDFRDFRDQAWAHCEETKNRVLIIDPPPKLELQSGDDVNSKANLTTSKYAVSYYPWVEVRNPLYDAERNPNAARTVLAPPSAFAAGIWSRTDGTRGVWKAPAGVESSLIGAVALQYDVADGEQDQLNPAGVNCFRRLPSYGLVVWGARTRATNADPEWRYVPVRRTAIMIEQSIYNGIQWAVFEPNDHRLWASLRVNIGSFMDGLFRAGAFQGEKASDAYFVRCGLGDTMTQGDIDRGQVVVIVGFAPLKPAEFVIVRIQQMVKQ